jgi:hypothetical protein
MIRVIGNQITAALLAACVAWIVAIAGCGPKVDLAGKTIAHTELTLSEAWYVKTPNGYELIGSAPSRPSLLSVLTLGGIKDADSPEYFVHVVASDPSCIEGGTASVLIAPWEGGRLFRGQLTGRIDQEGPNQVTITCDARLEPVSEKTGNTARLIMAGVFRRSERDFRRVMAIFDREMRRLAEIHGHRSNG